MGLKQASFVREVVPISEGPLSEVPLYYVRISLLQSYGGYMAGMVGSSGSGVFSAAISQSPVTTWYYYGKWQRNIRDITGLNYYSEQ